MDIENRTFHPLGAQHVNKGMMMARSKKQTDNNQEDKHDTDPTEVVDRDVAERVRSSMEEAGFTARDIGEAVGVSEKVVYGWARLGQISKHKLPAFASLVGVTEGWLLTGTGGQRYKQREVSDSVVDFKRKLSPEISETGSMTIRNLPVLGDIADLGNELQALPKGSELDTQEVRNNLVGRLFADPDMITTLPIPILNEESVGLPTFAIQIITDDHAPLLKMGAVLALSMDLLPDLRDYCIMARRTKASTWTLAAGYFHINQSILVTNHQEFYDTTSAQDLGISISLHRLPDEDTTDPFRIDCFHDEWLLIGVGVYVIEWLHQSLMLSQTRLQHRLDRRFDQRTRTKDDL